LNNFSTNKDHKKENSSSSFFIKTKIVISYLLLLLAVVSIFWITNREIGNLIRKDTSETISKEKMRFINEIFSGLYDAENFIIPMIINKSAFNSYSDKIDSVRYTINKLRSLSDTLQQNQLDTILFLLDEKEENLLNLMLLRGDNSLEELYRKNILKALSKEDLLKDYQTLETKIIVKQDTISYSKPSPRKNFFQRLAEAFSSSDPDTSIEVRSSQYTIMDSLTDYYNPADSISKIFEDIQQAIQKEREYIGAIIFSEISILQENNDLITLQLNSILRDFEKEELDRSFSLLEKREETIFKLKITIAIIAVITILSVLVFILLIWRDITKSRLYRQQLEEANKITRNLLENREKLMLSITHDIKAPLGSIIGYIELLNNSKLTERQLHFVSNMKSSSEHLLHLITDILDYNRLEAGHIQLHPLPFKPEKLFEEIISGFRPMAEKKGLLLLFEYNSEIVNETIEGDPIRISQIANNLLSNAIKFTDKGNVDMKIVISPADSGECLLKMIISDTGKGISAANQQRIFHEYERIESPDKHIEGFGLGLSIVQRLVEIQNGKISLSSEENKGSSFVVEIPLVISEEIKENNNISDSNLNILIIDDDKSQLVMVAEQLKSLGIKSVICNNPFSALEMLEKNSFDMVLTDIQMPELNGFEIIKQIRNGHLPNASTLPVIALSARADISNSSKFKEYGFSAFLNKPFTSGQLYKVISGLLHRKETSQEEEITVKKTTDNKFEKLFSFASGEKNAEKAILESFINESKINVENLLIFEKEKNIHALNKLCHKMLPIFRMINEKEISEWLSDMEKTTSFDQIDPSFFLHQINKIRKIIKEGEILLISYN
jgi:signal transduction histidine kinase/CheY-like chemotaxis protein